MTAATWNSHATLGDLQDHLGPFGFLWLSACAVYPRLYFPLTVLLGKRLADAVDRPPPDEDEHLALCRLPWFRDGFMPEALRYELVRAIPEAQRPVVRRAIEQILNEARREARFRLHAPSTEEFVEPASDWRRLLRGWLRSEAPPELRRDVIFVGYMLGRDIAREELALRGRAARRLGHGIRGMLDRATLLAGLVAAAAVAAMAVWGRDAIEKRLATEISVSMELPAESLQVRQDCAECPRIVGLAGGTFLMGSPLDEAGHVDDEGPQREVAISPFWIGQHEVTVGQFSAFATATKHETQPGCYIWTGSEWQLDEQRSWRDPGFAQAADHPVTCVGWDDAQAYVRWLGEVTGEAYRLPSEAEWEYAARAGTTTPFWTGSTISTEQANYDGNYVYGDGAEGVYREATTPVETFPASPWGLHDMHGNVWEWVEDCWHDNYRDAPVAGEAWLESGSGDCSRRVVRGGSWVRDPEDLRSAHRSRVGPVNRYNVLGFRVARMLTP